MVTVQFIPTHIKSSANEQMFTNIHMRPHHRSRAATVTHLAAGVLAAGRAAFPPLMGAGGAGTGALVTAAATRP